MLAVDLRGHGESGWPGEYSIALMAQDVVALLERLDEPSVDLVWPLAGRLVALRVAATHPPPVRRLVLEDVGMTHAAVGDPRHPVTTVAPDRPESSTREVAAFLV